MARPGFTQQPPEDAVDLALRQAARQRRRGDFRRAMQLLKQAAFEAKDNPALWTRYALCCMSVGRGEEGEKAFHRAVWLRERAGRKRAAAITQQLSELAQDGQLPRNYRRTNNLPWSPFALDTAGHHPVRPARKKESVHPYRRSRSRKGSH